MLLAFKRFSQYLRVWLWVVSYGRCVRIAVTGNCGGLKTIYIYIFFHKIKIKNIKITKEEHNFSFGTCSDFNLRFQVTNIENSPSLTLQDIIIPLLACLTFPQVNHVRNSSALILDLSFLSDLDGINVSFFNPWGSVSHHAIVVCIEISRKAYILKGTKNSNSFSKNFVFYLIRTYYYLKMFFLNFKWKFQKLLKI